MFGLEKSAARIIAILSGIALICVLCFGLAFCHQRDKAQKARGEAAVATSQASVGKDAANRFDGVRDAENANSRQTEQNTDYITKADGANADAGEAGLRGRIVWCKRERMRGKPDSVECDQLRRVHPEQFS